MHQQLVSGSSLPSTHQPHSTLQPRWRKFDAHAPAAGEMVEIRRLHDDKTILRRRADLPPSFDWRKAEWRPL